MNHKQIYKTTEIFVTNLPAMAYFLGENANCPVYIQRYAATVNVLKENAVEQVIDFGCAELNFALRLKNEKFVKKVCAVDIDEKLLQRSYIKLNPLTVDYIESQRREHALTYTVFCGSVAEKDERLLGYEAVTCIELIEHLENDILEKLPAVIFGFIKPKIAIFTTPNSDFNVLFKDFTGFRHWDHKFEWSRVEFKEWCDNILKEYPDYTVEISGVGEGPAGSEHLGCCSQMSVFKLSENVNSEKAHNKSVDAEINPYKLIIEINYPVKTIIPIEDQIYNLAIYNLNEISKSKQEDTYEEILDVPLSELLLNKDLFNICTDENTLKKILIDRGQDVSTDLTGKFIVKYRIWESDDELSDYENYEYNSSDEQLAEKNVVTDEDYWD